MLDFIEHIIYINLASRPDRKKQIEETLSCFPPERIHRFEAIQEQNGLVGCCKSHIGALKYARQMNWNHVLILEDDSIWSSKKEGVAILDRLIKVPFDVILLSGTYVEYEQLSFRLNSAQCANAYIVSNHYYTTLIEFFEHSLYRMLETGHVYRFAHDIAWKQLQAVDNWFIVVPCLMIQSPGYSDILKSEQDYTKLFI